MAISALNFDVCIVENEPRLIPKVRLIWSDFTPHRHATTGAGVPAMGLAFYLKGFTRLTVVCAGVSWKARVLSSLSEEMKTFYRRRREWKHR